MGPSFIAESGPALSSRAGCKSHVVESGDTALSRGSSGAVFEFGRCYASARPLTDLVCQSVQRAMKGLEMLVMRNR